MKQRYIEVIPAVKFGSVVGGVFSYSIPTDWPDLPKGSVVEVEFGKKNIPAVVLRLSEDVPDVKIKTARKILWSQGIITEQLFALADYISSEYIVSQGVVMRMMTIKNSSRAKYKPFNSLRTPDQYKKFELTDEQQISVKSLTRTINTNSKILLHGITGSGKTEVYLQLMEEVVRSGKQVLVLVPEIALTPQTASRIASRFQSGQTAIVHSRISYGQKALIWSGINEGSFKVLVGPRSALFAPFKKLGAIIMDEEHDSSFKQFEQHPKYDSRRVAAFLSDLWGCPLIFSDATPSIETYYQAVNKKYAKLVLSRRPSQPLPQVQMMNMQDEVKSGNFSILSTSLLSAIRQNLGQGRQVILFINRRGTYTSLLCRDCGKLTLCFRCEAPLVYHHSRQALMCHHCNKVYPVPAQCSNCGSHRLRFQGTGTEKVEDEVQKIFPNARIRRLDSDSMKNKTIMENVQSEFAGGNFDILVGTQMLAKGWDLSGVGLIGVVNSDTMLALPDYRANERTFQIITQVAGRAGRGAFPGKVIMQTFSPDNIAIKAAMNHDYETFFNSEIKEREEFHYPPFARIIKLSVAKKDKQKAETSAEKLTQELKSLSVKTLSIDVVGPAPGFIPKIKNLHTFYVIIKLVQPYEQKIPQAIHKLLSGLDPDWDVDVDPDSIL